MPKVTNIPPNEGKVIEIDGAPVAVYNDGERLHAFSAVCPHEACDIEWNGDQKNWICPCHGSRFTATGGVINPPAKTDLERRELGA
ncbi:MAG: Rieske 2Fe-2S domain-containing protein [Patescibacteria group bacterium]|nr:Rieske 2Fe-2S domain-containing protein [Patescibacteria group bacterium]